MVPFQLIIKINLDNKYSDFFEKKYDKIFEEEAFKALIHEATHMRDVLTVNQGETLSYKKSGKGLDDYHRSASRRIGSLSDVERNREEEKIQDIVKKLYRQYMNLSYEVRAKMQEVAYEVISYSLDNKLNFTNSSFRLALSKSNSYNSSKDSLGSREKKTLLKGVYTAFMDAKRMEKNAE
jgi:hypothetical protein